MHSAAGSSHQPAWRSAVGIGQSDAAGHQPGLLGVGLGHLDAAPGEDSLEPGEQIGIDRRLEAGRLRNRLPRQVVGRWPKPPVEITRSAVAMA
jgi:hypothetical protein